MFITETDGLYLNRFRNCRHCCMCVVHIFDSFWLNLPRLLQRVTKSTRKRILTHRMMETMLSKDWILRLRLCTRHNPSFFAICLHWSLGRKLKRSLT